MSTIQQQTPVPMRQDTLYVFEKSIHAAFHVFTDLTQMSPQEAFMIQNIYEGYKNQNDPVGIIFIRSLPETSLSRAINRGYPSDNQLTLKTIEVIHNRYEKWLSKNELPVYYIDEDDVLHLKPENIIESAMSFFKCN